MMVPIVNPSVADVLRLPTPAFMVRAGALSMAATAGVILVRMAAQRVFARRNTHVVSLELISLRCSLSVWLGMGVVGGASVAFQAAVRSSTTIPKMMNTAVSGLRLCAGLPAGDHSPYTEMVGGTCLQNASAAADFLCRVLRVPLVPQVSVFGVNVVPLSDADQAALFGSGGSGERFLTPSRLLTLTLQCVFAAGAARAAQYALRRVVSPTTTFPRPWWHLRAWMAAAPLAMWEVLVLAGDCEQVGPIPTPTVYAGLLAVHALVINRWLWGRYPRNQPPSAASTYLELQIFTETAELHLQYAPESVVAELLPSLVLYLIRENSSALLAGTLFLLGETKLSEDSTSVLSECGIDSIGNLETVWDGDRDRVPVVCGLCNVLFRGAGIVRMPCCGEYLHASCLSSLFFEPSRRRCPRCETPHPRTIRKPAAMEFVSKVGALDSWTEVSRLLQSQAWNVSGKVLELFGARCRRGALPVVLSTQDLLTTLFRHPSPTPTMTRTASALSDIMYTYHESSALAGIAAALLFPIPTMALFPERMCSPGLGSIMMSRSPTLPGRVLSTLGTLLHFYIPHMDDDDSA